jgi:hypothetical protein
VTGCGGGRAGSPRRSRRDDEKRGTDESHVAQASGEQ